MQKSILIFILFLSGNTLFAQYDSECYVTTKKEIKLTIEKIIKEPGDSVRFQDTLMIAGSKRYVDTVLRVWTLDNDPYVKKFIGCRMPDFTFFTINKDEMSVNKITSDFTLISFSSTTYGDVSNARLYQFCKLKTLLNDSLVVLNVFEEEDEKVVEYSKNYAENVEFIANADLITYNYTFNGGTIIYLLDKYKNIIYVKSGHRYNYTPDEIYSELLEKIRAYDCAD